MVFFFSGENKIIAVQTRQDLDESEVNKLSWIFGGAVFFDDQSIKGTFIGPRKEMVTPWSTNAVEITQNMGIGHILRIEEFRKTDSGQPSYDPMLQALYHSLDQDLFTVHHQPDPIRFIENIQEYNEQQGLALAQPEVDYLNELSKKLGRKLTDSEVFGFSQVNSEHCRHKIFNGVFVIDGKENDLSLFQLIKLTTSKNKNRVVSAYKDNCAFLQGRPLSNSHHARPIILIFLLSKTLNLCLH